MMRKRWLIVGLTAVFTVLFLTMNVTATGSYQIPWWSVDGGGGSSVGDRYALVGTIGQPDAGHMESDHFALTGGFWAQPTESIPTPPEGYVLYLPLVRKK